MIYHSLRVWCEVSRLPALLIKMPKRQSERESGEGMLSTDLPLLDEIPKETEDVYKRKHR